MIRRSQAIWPVCLLGVLALCGSSCGSSRSPNRSSPQTTVALPTSATSAATSETAASTLPRLGPLVAGGDADLQRSIVAWEASIYHDSGGIDLSGTLTIDGGCLSLKTDTTQLPIALPDTVRITRSGDQLMIADARDSSKTLLVGDSGSFGVMPVVPTAGDTGVPLQVEVGADCAGRETMYFWSGFPST
jgi:hypothetical protein